MLDSVPTPKSYHHQSFLQVMTASAACGVRLGAQLLAGLLVTLVSCSVAGLCSAQSTSGSIAGRVRDDAGAPMANTEVAAGLHTTKTDAQGWFAITDVKPGSYDVLFGPPPETDLVGDLMMDYSFRNATKVKVEAGKVSHVEKTFARGGRLEVTVLEAGVPVARAEVFAPSLFASGAGSFAAEPLFDRGRFIYWGLPPRNNYEIDFHPPGFARQKRTGIAITAGQTTRITLRFDPSDATGLSGTLRLADGQPAADVVIYVVNEATSTESGESKTNAEGRFRIVGLPAGRYRVGALGAPALASVQVVAGVTAGVTLTWPEQP
jgi:hypothetical protein